MLEMIRNKIKRVGFIRKFYHFLRRNTLNRILFRKNIKDIEKFDMKHKTDFGGRLYQGEIGVTIDRANDYSPSPTKELIRVMRNNGISNDDSIVDLGCGKGYAMYIMSAFPIEKLGGVELSEKLCMIAQNNLRNILPQEIKWEVVCADAAKWDGYEAYNIFYIYNSFPRTVMEEVKERINKSVEMKPRKVIVWYLYPQFPDVFYDDDNWKLISRGSFFKIRHGMHIFEHLNGG